MKKYCHALSFFIPFVIYVLTLSSEVTFFDSGEFIAASVTLGTGHPPGYPIYIMISHIFKYLPFGNAAFKVALCSAVFGSLASLMTFLIAREVMRREDNKELLALTAALVFAFSYTFWGQGVFTKFYCLSTFLIASGIYMTIKYEHDAGRQYLFAACFIFGVSICAHYTAAVLFPIIITAVIIKERKLLSDLKTVMVGFFFFLFGFGIFLYLPFRAWQTNALVWGDPQTLTQFLWVILRKGYEMEGTPRSFGLFFDQMKSFNLYREFGIVALFFIIFGFLTTFRRFLIFSFMTLIVLLVLNVGVVLYGNPVSENIFLLESFHGPGYMMLSVFAACAVFEIGNTLEKFRIKKKIAHFLCLAILPGSLLFENYRSNDWSNYHVAYDYGRNVLKSCERDSVLFTWGDSGAFPLWYLQTVENYRTDVILLHCPHLDAYWYWRDKINLVDKNRLMYMWESSRGPDNMVRFLVRDLSSRKQIHFDYSTKYSVMLPGIVFVPDGLVYTYSESSRPAKKNNLNYFVMRDLQDSDILKDLDTQKAVSIYAYCFFDMGVHQVMNNDPFGKALIKSAVDIMPALRPQALSVIGQE
jgi:hypothetical protein